MLWHDDNYQKQTKYPLYHDALSTKSKGKLDSSLNLRAYHEDWQAMRIIFSWNYFLLGDIFFFQNANKVFFWDF
jgi:hypothetical protein